MQVEKNVTQVVETVTTVVETFKMELSKDEVAALFVAINEMTPRVLKNTLKDDQYVVRGVTVATPSVVSDLQESLKTFFPEATVESLG